ncbi:MAG: GUN4 domain-containing protein [Cyanobacteria bacterium J06627_8]
MARAALLVGIREYGSELDALPASPRDVEALAAVLKRQDLGMFHPVVTLSDDRQPHAVSKSGLESALENWCREHRPGDIALLYISGHLILDRHHEVFLASRESRYENGSLIRSSAVSGTFIRQCLQRSAATAQVIILDCCVQPIDARAAYQCPHALDIVRHFWGDRRVVLLNSADFCYSPAQKQNHLSLYTQFLVEGMVTGLADANGDQQVSVQELHHYAEQKLSIATPAIAPKLFTSSDSSQLAETAMTSAEVPSSHRQYCSKVGRFIDRHGVDGSRVSQQALSALQHQLGIKDEVAQGLYQTVLTPYTMRNASLSKYREIAAQFIQSEPFSHPEADAQLESACYELGLTEAAVEPINQELRYLHQLRRLEQYRNELTDALKHEQPLSETTKQDLTDLCRSLGISEQDEQMINAEVEAYWKTHQQKLAQYRLKFRQAVDSGVAKNPLIREELDNFRQSLGLSNSDIEPIEQEIQNAMTSSSMPPHSSQFHPSTAAGDINELHQRQNAFKKAFIKAANHRLPPTKEDQQRLDLLQQELQLPLDWVNSFKANVYQTLKEQESAYQEGLDAYEQHFQSFVDQEGFPLSEASRQKLYDLENDLHIKAHDVRAVEQKLESHWKAEQAEAEWSPSVHDESTADEFSHDDGYTTAAQSLEPDSGFDLSELLNEVREPHPDQPSDDAMSNPATLPPTALEHDLTQLPTMPGTNGSRSSSTLSDTAFFASFPSARSKRRAEDASDETMPQSVNAAAEPSIEPRFHGGDLSDQHDELASDRDIDYRTLHKLLREHQWREADHETYSILVQLGKFGQPGVEWPNLRAIDNLPATDLQTIDRLWSIYSSGKFGFREQYRMYDLASGYSKHELYAAYGKIVKWMLFEQEFTGFKYYNQLIFDHQLAPRGHLPAKWFWEISPWESIRCGGLGTGRGGCGRDNDLLANFMTKLKACGFLVPANPGE